MLNYPDLGYLPLFEQFPLEKLGQVLLLMNEAHFPKGATLMTPERNCGKVYFLTRGSVKILIRRPNTPEMLLAILGAGEILGELSAIYGIEHSATVITTEETQVLALTNEAFVCLLKKEPVLSWNLVNILGQRLRRVTDHAEILATLDVTGRLARQLIIFAEDYGQAQSQGGVLIPLRLTQGDLAALVGASREKVNRVLKRFRSQSILTTNEHRHIVLLNTKQLMWLSR